MNILFLALDVDLGDQRGDAIHVLELARSLARIGHTVDLVTATRAVPEIGPEVRHHRRPDASDYRIVRMAAEVARGSASDVVYERRLSPKIAYAVSRLRGIPFVMEVNGIEEEAAMQRGHRRSASAPWKRRVRGRMIRRAARIVAVTDRLGATMRERYGLAADRVVTVPNGVDAKRFAPIAPADARARIGWDPAPWVTFVGNLVPWQGVETLIRAAPAVLREVPDVRFAIVGDGISRAGLERLTDELGVRGAVRFAGAVPYPEVPLYVCAADVCVAPFTRKRNEAIGLSPLKVYEYLACGRPVVASDVPGISDLLRRASAGLTAPPDDPAALAGRLVHLLTHPDEAKLMGTRGRAYAAAECTWDRTAQRVAAVLQSATAHSR